jgi:NTP pyrophosphatase (non-canonical NTP hydrolase)
MAGYHETYIPRGMVGEFSKIEEEFLEARDAFRQGNPVMLIQELSDLLGAIDLYARKYNLTLDDLITMMKVTRRVFESGYRESRPPENPPMLDSLPSIIDAVGRHNLEDDDSEVHEGGIGGYNLRPLENERLPF